MIKKPTVITIIRQTFITKLNPSRWETRAIKEKPRHKRLAGIKGNSNTEKAFADKTKGGKIIDFKKSP